MFGEEPANTMGDILAAAGGAVVNSEADDISAFIDLSVLIRDFHVNNRSNMAGLSPWKDEQACGGDSI